MSQVVSQFRCACAFVTQIARIVMPGVTRSEMNMPHEFVAVTVAQVEPTSTSRDGCGNKKNARRGSRQRLVQLVSPLN